MCNKNCQSFFVALGTLRLHHTQKKIEHNFDKIGLTNPVLTLTDDGRKIFYAEVSCSNYCCVTNDDKYLMAAS